MKIKLGYPYEGRIVDIKRIHFFKRYEASMEFYDGSKMDCTSSFEILDECEVSYNYETGAITIVPIGDVK